AGGAVGAGALLAGKVGAGTGTAVPILSGGNIDATMLISVMRHGLTSAGRYLVVRTHVSDRPGELIKVLSLVAEERGNVIAVEHHREGMEIPVNATEGDLPFVPREEDPCLHLPAAWAARGYVVERLRWLLPPQRRNDTIWPGQSSTPPSSTGRASTPAAVRTLAAIDARAPDSQIVITGLLLSSPSVPVSRRRRYGMCSVPGM